MAKKIVLVLFAVAGLGLSSCATYATRGGVTTPLGSFTSAGVNASRGAPIAEYAIILGMITLSYDKFLEQTKGKDIDIIDVNYFNLYRKVQAVKRN